MPTLVLGEKPCLPVLTSLAVHSRSATGTLACVSIHGVDAGTSALTRVARTLVDTWR